MGADERKQVAGMARVLLGIPVPWVFVMAYLAGVGVEAAFHVSRFLRDYNYLTPAGAVVFAVGGALAGWAWLIFRHARTTRVPGEVSTKFVTWGPYRLTRNPMYLGLSIAYVGEAGILHQIVPVLFLPLVIAYLNRVVLPIEEERLAGVFGAEYEAYRSKVRRWI